MNTKRVKNSIAILLFALLTAIACAFASVYRAAADGELSFVKVLNFTDAELTALVSPQKVCRGEKYTAINENNEKISVFDNRSGKKIAEFSSSKTLGEIKTYDENEFLIIQEGSIYKLYFDGDELKDEFLVDENDRPFGLNFDYNGRYLVVSHETVTKIYTLSDIQAQTVGETLSSALNSPVAINGNDEIFYLNSENDLKIYSLDGVSRTIAKNISFSERSVDLIATEDRVYYLGRDDALYSVVIPAEDGLSEPVKLETDDSAYPDYEKYDLGKLASPTGICINGENILISDSSIGAAQEFRLTANDKIAFTGYAIADGKTAFNRVSESVKDVEKYKNTVAVLDDFKLTLFADDGDVDLYSYDTFKNFFVGAAPELFALGNEKILSFKNGALSLTEINGGSTVLLSGTFAATDLCYQSGYFYVLAGDTVYKINETESPTEVLPAFSDFSGNVLSVDVLKNATTVQGTVLSEIKTDLIGDVFGIYENGFYKYDKDAATAELLFSVPQNLKSFAMGFEDSVVYFAFDGGKTLYKTQDLGNKSISSLLVPENFNRKDEAINLEDFKVYSAKESANLYSVDYSGESFVFLSLSSRDNKYVLLAKIDVDNERVYALSGLSGIILINSAEAEEIPVALSESPENLYVTTSVHMYALPILTLSEENKLVIGETDYYLSRGKALSTDGNSKFVFDGKEFYFCSYNSENGVVYGYVPADFTTEVLDETEIVSKFSIKHLSSATVYADEELTTELVSVADGTKIKVFGANGNVLKIAVKIDGDWIVGYVSADKIKDAPNVTLRNVLIVIAVAATLAGTASYFILRKKQ